MKLYKNKHILLFRKCQVILEKLGVHSILLSLMRYGEKGEKGEKGERGEKEEKGVYGDLGKSLLEFFRYFVEDC